MTTDTSRLCGGVVEARGVRRVLGGRGTPEQAVLSDVSLAVSAGEFVALTGPSGSGKSSLLYLLGALDRPTDGEVWIEGLEVGRLDEDQRAEFRNERLGFVFQFHFLLPEFSALENVAIPMLRRGWQRDEAEARALDTLELLGLAGLRDRRPNQLSGGQQQRIAIARALGNDPAILLADEPTGSLDSKNAESVFEILADLAAGHGRTIVMVTHDASFAERAGRQVSLRDGRIVEDVCRPRRARCV